MNVAILGGAGAMGGIVGGLLAPHAHVTLVDVWQEAVAAINAEALKLEDRDGEVALVPLQATSDPATVGPVDLVVVFVKCYHTEAAVRSAAPLLGPGTTVLTLQNGWGNAPRISALVGAERVLVGLTYNSGTLVGPGHVKHTARGTTYIGELNGTASERQARVVSLLNAAGLETEPTDNVLQAIWTKLTLNTCALPTAALLRFTAGELVAHAGTLALMRGILEETVAVAQAQGIALDLEERWESIVAMLTRAGAGKASMLQDVERRRRTEIDVINGAVVEAGVRLGVATPYNQAMVHMVKALEETFAS
jgi:2-dehydropantoate 2-reductase